MRRFRVAVVLAVTTLASTALPVLAAAPAAANSADCLQYLKGKGYETSMSNRDGYWIRHGCFGGHMGTGDELTDTYCLNSLEKGHVSAIDRIEACSLARERPYGVW
ncbi:hypothetical protein AB0C93_19735 [Streptomyces sp. NPDC048518]|uniref:hypothetical protein n=1 Tax=Streptomyces sp. NPDC048518 TaxID=3155029 RepID=UPI00340B7E33